MNEWRIQYWLESGAHVVGKYVGPERDTNSVANKIIVGNHNEFFGLYGEDEQHNLLVKKGAIVACDISPWKE